MKKNNRFLHGACAIAFGMASALAAGPAGAAEKLTFNMAWLPQGSVAGPIIAKSKGWFEEAGLEVELSRGYGGSRTANEIDQGLFDIGYVDPVNVALNRHNGGSLRMVGVINGEWPAGICYVKKDADDQRGLDDLLGLRMGGGAFSPVHNILPVWLEMNGQDKNAIKLLRLEPAVVDASLLEGRIDLAECWRASNRAVLEKLAVEAGKDIGWVEYADHGLNVYGSGFAVADKLIAERPDALRAFLKASYRGYAFALENPEAAADILVEAYPSLDRGITREQLRDLGSLIAPEGEMEISFDPKQIDQTMTLITGAFGVPEGAIEAGDLYSNAFTGD